MNDQPPSPRDWLVLFLLMTVMLFSFVDRFVLSLLIEPIKRDLGLEDAQIGLLNGLAFGLFYAAMGIPLGWLADRWSRTGTMMFGVAIWSLSTGLSGFASSFVHLIAARIGVGAGEAGLAPASFGLIHDRFPRRFLARATSVFQLGGALGSGCALLVAGAVYHFFLGGGGAALPIIGQLAPWQQTFIAVASPGALFVVLLSMVHDPQKRALVGNAHALRQSATGVLRDHAGFFAMLFIGMSCVMAATYALLSWMPAILQREFGWSPGQVGKSYGLVVLIASPLGLVTGGIATDWLYTRGIRGAHVLPAIVAATLGVPLMVCIGLVQSAGALLAVAGVLQAVLALPVGVIPALVQMQTPAGARGRISGLFVLTVNLIGLGLMPTLIGLLSSRLGQSTTVLRTSLVVLTVPVLLIGLVLLQRLWRMMRLRRAPDDLQRPEKPLAANL